MLLGNQDASTTNSLDLFFGALREEASLDNARDFWQLAFGQDLSETSLQGIDDGNRAGLAGETSLIRDQSPQFVQVDNGAVFTVLGVVETTHTDLTKVARMVAIQVSAMVMHTTSHTTTTWMLTMLADTTVTGRDVSALLAIFLIYGCLKFTT